eukprot:1258054-Amphidinium_carterae.1
MMSMMEALNDTVGSESLLMVVRIMKMLLAVHLVQSSNALKSGFLRSPRCSCLAAQPFAQHLRTSEWKECGTLCSIEGLRTVNGMEHAARCLLSNLVLVRRTHWHSGDMFSRYHGCSYPSSAVAMGAQLQGSGRKERHLRI